jgi:hypothetical protein
MRYIRRIKPNTKVGLKMFIANRESDWFPAWEPASWGGRNHFGGEDRRETEDGGRSNRKVFRKTWSVEVQEK